jgi:hypothetical protein
MPVFRIVADDSRGRPQRDEAMLDWVRKADRMLIDSYAQRTGIDFSNHKPENLMAIDQYFLGVQTREKARSSRKYRETNAIAIASYLGQVMVQNLGGSWRFPSALEALFVRLLGNPLRMQKYWYVLLGREKVFVLSAALEAIDRTAREFSVYDFYQEWERRSRSVAAS